MIIERTANLSRQRPTVDDLLARARALAPAFGARRPQADERNDLPPESVDELYEAGLFNVLRPAAFGGWEMDLRDFFDIQNAIAEHCLSTAWVYGVLSIQAFMLSRFDTQAQADVWGGPGRGLMSSSFRPGGQAVRVDGGYRLTGRNWTFSSGSSFCQWALLGAMVAPDADHPQPEMRICIVPREEYEIIDTWRTFGLRGTGSNDIHATDVFVPAHRTWKPAPELTPISRADRPGPALYRLPWQYAFLSSISNLSIGAGRGAIDAFRKAPPALGPPPVPGIPALADTAPGVLARAYADIEGIDAAIKQHVGVMMDHIAADRPMAVAECLGYRTFLTSAARRVAHHVDKLMLLLGGRAIQMDGALTRTWLDLSAACHHPGNNPDLAAHLLGMNLTAPPAA